MVSYARRVAICDSVREAMKKALAESADAGLRLKVNNIPNTDTVLRAATRVPSVDAEERLKAFIIEYALGVLNVTEVQREHLNLRS
jgi:hypothetical protein